MAAPTYGKNSFYSPVRPKGRPKPKASPPPRPGASPKGRSAAPPTLAQTQLSEAAQIAAMAIDPQVTSINEAVLAAETQRINRTRAAEGVTRALAALSAGDAESARAAYADAAARLSQYGAGLTGSLRSLQQGAADKVSAAIGAPVESSAAENANVAQMLGVVIPGEGLAASAPRALQQAQAHRLAAGLRLADDASAADFRAGGEISQLRSKIEEIESKRPGLIFEALQDIKQAANAKRATDVQIGYLQLQQAKTVQDRAIAMTNLTGTLHVVVGQGQNARVVDTRRPASGSDAGQAEIRAETSRANAALAAETARAAAAQRATTAAQLEAGRNARAAATIAANKELAKIKAQQKKNQPATTAQKNTILNGANASGTNVAKAIDDRIWADTVGAVPKDASPEEVSAAQQAYTNRRRNNRGTMMFQVINTIAPNLKLIGYTTAQIRVVAERIVGRFVPASKAPPPLSGR